MKLCKTVIIALTVLLVVPMTVAAASDFSWTRDFNIQAKADPMQFKSRFATRFNLNYLQVNALLNIFDTPADAYIMLRFGEMKGVLKTLSREQGIKAVKKYRNNKNKGWDEMASILGINPGSEEFNALKQGHDLPGANMPEQALYTAAYEEKPMKIGFKN